MTFIGGPVASPFLKVFYKQYGSVAYFFAYIFFCGLLAVASPVVGVMMLSFSLSIYIYSLLEERGVPFFKTALIALCVPVGLVFVAVLGAAGWSFRDLHETLMAVVNMMVEMMAQAGMKTDHVNTELIVRLFPGGIVSFFVIGLGSAVAMEKRVHHLFGYHFEKYASQLKPLEFKMPDEMIWITLLSLAMAVSGQLTVFKGAENSGLLMFFGAVGQNLSIVLATIYFFQGLAILEVYLTVLRAGALMRFFAYFALVLNLVLVLSAIGFLDYWLDFRKRLRKQVEKQRRMI